MIKLTPDNREVYCDLIINKKINNIKGLSFQDRFIDILSDPNNLSIPRHVNAGKIIDDNIIMHNGLKVVNKCYYGDFSDVLVTNKGCHEPAEERMFQHVLNDINDGGLMIELGSYWAFYSMWFNSMIKNAVNYCIEPDINSLNIGEKNCEINNINCHFIHGVTNKLPINGLESISAPEINLKDFINDNAINFVDLLHSDIQGSELNLLTDISILLKEKKIKYLFISTHSNDIHYKCIDFLKQHDYRIIASSDFENQTFCFDGIIVACQKDNLKIPEISLGNRKHTKLRKKCLV